jgi:hypothetical protein
MTVKVTSQHHLIYEYLLSKFGRRQAKQYAESNQAAIESYASIVSSRNIACDFVRKPADTYAGSEYFL